MPTYMVHCKECGQEFAPSRESIQAGNWKVCPRCRPDKYPATTEPRTEPRTGRI